MPTLNDLDAIGGASVPLWVSGETVTQWDYRKSPINGETYQRTTATGGGTTDPASDTTNYAAKSYRRISSLPAKPGIDVVNPVATQFAINGVKAAINGITAGTRTKVLDISGRGVCNFLAVLKNASNGGLVEIIVDGITIFNATAATASASIANLFIGMPAAGDPGIGTSRPFLYAVPESGGIEFKSSLVVWYTPTTSATGADAVLVYEVRATR